MRYAAEYPQDLAALVIEDIDCVPWGEPSPTEEDLQRRRHFNRRFPSWEACRSELISFGYAEKRVDSWLVEDPPRVFKVGGGNEVWSALNPLAQHLATDTVGNAVDGFGALHRIAAAHPCGMGEFPVHLFVAGQHGCCSWDALPGGIHDMCSVVPGTRATHFPIASHSIHNTARGPFLDSLEEIVRMASVR